MMLLPKSEKPASKAPSTYPSILSALTADKWQVVNEGASGAQLRRPRVMTMQTKVILAIGMVGLLAWGIGLVFIIVGLVDYYVLTKEHAHFLSRENPAMPPIVVPRKMPAAIKAMVWLIAFIIVAASFVALTGN